MGSAGKASDCRGGDTAQPGTVPVTNTIIPLFRNTGDNLQCPGQECLTPVGQAVMAVAKGSQKYNGVACITAGLGESGLAEGRG